MRAALARLDLDAGWLRVGEVKTDAGTRRIKIRGALRAELARLRAKQTAADPDDFVFPTSTGNRAPTTCARA